MTALRVLYTGHWPPGRWGLQMGRWWQRDFCCPENCCVESIFWRRAHGILDMLAKIHSSGGGYWVMSVRCGGRNQQQKRSCVQSIVGWYGWAAKSTKWDVSLVFERGGWCFTCDINWLVVSELVWWYGRWVDAVDLNCNGWKVVELEFTTYCFASPWHHLFFMQDVVRLLCFVMYYHVIAVVSTEVVNKRDFVLQRKTQPRWEPNNWLCFVL